MLFLRSVDLVLKVIAPRPVRIAGSCIAGNQQQTIKMLGEQRRLYVDSE